MDSADKPAPTLEFCNAILEERPDGWALRTIAGVEPVTVDPDSARVPVGELEPWILRRRADGLPVVKLDLHPSNSLRARRRREAADAALTERVGPVRMRTCPDCGTDRSEYQFSDNAAGCVDCEEAAAAAALNTPVAPDDRDPSTSIRAYRGGAPGLGRGR